MHVLQIEISFLGEKNARITWGYHTSKLYACKNVSCFLPARKGKLEKEPVFLHIEIFFC